MRAVGLLDTGTRGDEGLHHVQLPHHRRRKNGRSSAVIQKEVGDRLIADMRSRVDARFPVAKAPIHRGTGHRRLLLDQLADARHVAV
jgi:hypothetical protein